MNFVFFVAMALKLEKFHSTVFGVFGGGKVQNRACGTAFHRVNGGMVVDVGAL